MLIDPESTPIPERNPLLDDPFLGSVPVHEGFKVLDRCVLYAKLGSGGMGAVYRGKHLKLDVDVAVKCLKPNLAASDAEYVVRFQREANTAARLGSDNLVRVLDVDSKYGVHYLVMEYVAGETLAARLRRKGPLSAIEAATIVFGAAKGLAAAHAEKIVHRDIKPENIMISVKGAVKVADLGLARAVGGDHGMTLSGLFMGTPYYAPPEQFRSAKSVGPAADVWSLGATLYELLTGRRAFNGDALEEVMYKVNFDAPEDLQVLRPEIPRSLSGIVDRCLKKRPEDRFPDAAELADVLEDFLRSQGKKISLADPAAGEQSAAMKLVSPPPGETLARIKLAISEGNETRSTRPPEPEKKSPAPQPENSKAGRAPAPAIPPAALPTHSRRSGIGIAIGALLLIAAAFIGVKKFGGFGEDDSKGPRDNPQSRPSVTPESQPNGPDQPTDDRPIARRYRDGVAKRAALDFVAAVDLFRLVYEENPRYEDIGRQYPETLILLANAESKSGRQSPALVAARRAQTIDDTAETRTIVTAIERLLRADLEKALSIKDPPPEAVVGKSDFTLRGEVAYAEEAKLEVLGQSTTPQSGRFTIAVKDQPDGRRELKLRLIDTATDIAIEKSHAIIVDTQSPRVAIDSPAADAVLPLGKVTVRGTVNDLTTVEITVNGQRIEVAPPQTVWEITLDDVAEGRLTLSGTAIDVALNKAAIPPRSFMIQRPAPAVTRKTLTWAKPKVGTEYTLDGYPKEVIHTKTGIEMVFIPAGRFLMGSSDEDLKIAKQLYDLIKDPQLTFEVYTEGEKQHEVRITKPFYLAKYEISNAVYKKWKRDHTSKEYKTQSLDGDEQPAVYVSWDDAKKFCTENDLRLPFEAEWEYAARGRTDQKSEVFPWGNRADDGAGHCNVSDQRAKRDLGFSGQFSFDDGYAVTCPVTTMKPNGFGLHQMIGNVWEWCEDWYDAAYYTTAAAGSDPHGPSSSPQSARVLRGGSWYNDPIDCRSAYRSGSEPTNVSIGVGFRPARDP